MAGAGALDDEALLDLAEIRWRTGDLPGAGEAATAYLASGRESVLGLVIAAEATAALGRPGEARRLAGRALEAATGPLEPLFAGQEMGAAGRSDAAMGAMAPASSTAMEEGGQGGATPTTTASSFAPPRSGALAVTGQAAEAVPASLWEAHPHSAIPAPPLPDGRAELDAAHEALGAGDVSTAAVRLAVALRVSPSLAPAVIDMLAGTKGPEFDLIRGDAYRLVGHEAEAQRAYAAVAAAVGDITANPAATLDAPGVDLD